MKPTIPYLEIKYINKFDLIDKLLKIYDIANPIPEADENDERKNKRKAKHLRKFERDILIYYIMYGYSKDTKNLIESDTGKKLNLIVQVDHNLKEAGYLEDLEYNSRMKKLNPKLEKIRENFILKNNRAYGIWFQD